jgi:hypothetical protein
MGLRKFEHKLDTQYSNSSHKGWFRKYDDKKDDYRNESFYENQYLRDMEEEGWELCTVIIEKPTSSYGPQSTRYTYYWKRQIE